MNYNFAPIEQFISQSGFKFDAPGMGWFKTTDQDNIFFNTGKGVKAFGINASQGNVIPEGLDLSKLPTFNSGFLADFVQQKYGQGQITAEKFDANTFSQWNNVNNGNGNETSTAVQKNGEQAPMFTSALQFGAQGSEVTKLQNYLISQGYQIAAGATGYFGEQTKQALSKFQQDKGITANQNELGFFGPKTLAFLNGGQQTQNQNGYGLATATGVATPSNISGVASLYSNATISALEKKIGDMSASLAAGISAGGSTQILSELFTKFGIEKEISLVNQYNATILEQQNKLKQLPDDIKKTLEDVGVSESQLNRLVVKESQKPLEVLQGLMEQKGAAQDRIQQSLTFVRLFADAAMQDQAAKLEGMKFELETNKELLKNLKKEQIDFLNLALDEKKEIMKFTNTAIQNGASQSVVNKILQSSTQQEAAKMLAESGFGKSLTSNGKTDVLTLNELKDQYPGLPTSLVGKPELDIIQDLQGDTAPSWFVELIQKEKNMSMSQQAMQDEWIKFLETVYGDSDKSGEEIDFNNL